MGVSKPLSGRSLLQGIGEIVVLTPLRSLQTAKRSFTFASKYLFQRPTTHPDVSKPLSGRSLLQEMNQQIILKEGHVSKPLSGRSLLQAKRLHT